MTTTARAALISQFSALPQQLETLVAPLATAQCAAQPAPGAWSVAQVVHHLADSRMVSFMRVKWVLTEEDAAYPTYDEGAWAMLPDVDHGAIGDSLELIGGLHRRWRILLESLTEETWARTGVHAVTRQVLSIEEMLRRYAGHGEAHLAQIRRTLAGYSDTNTEHSGSTTQFAFRSNEAHMTAEERAALVAKIAALPQQLEALVCDLTPAQLTARPLAGEWSVAQNVHHLADSHMNSFVRIKNVLTEENSHYKPYDQDAWAELPDANNAAIGDSLEMLRGLHKRWVRLYAGLPEEAWARTGTNPETNRTYTMEEILGIYGNHGEAHLDQIRRTLAAAE